MDRRRLTRLVLVTALFGSLALAGGAHAAAGALDDGFAGNGKQTLCLHKGCGLDFHDVFPGPDGTAITAGWTFAEASGYPGFTRDLVLARYQRSGLPDPSFGHDGVVETESLGSPSLYYGDAVVDREGRILVSGSMFQKPFDGLVIRYLPDGSVDHSFGKGGVARTIQPADSLAIAQDGSVFVAGGSDVTKLKPNGDPDLSYSGGRAKWIHRGGLVVEAMALDRKGGLVGAGAIHGGDKERKTLALARLDSKGEVDHTFGHGGIATAHFSRHSEARALALGRDDRILAVGTRGASSLTKPSLFALARFRSNGSLDRSFSDNGIRTTDFRFPDVQYAASVLVQPDGRAIVAGAGSDAYRSGKIVAARYLRDGRLDASFGRRGKIETAFPHARGYDGMCAGANSAAMLAGKRFAIAGFQYGCDELEEGYTGPGHLGALAVYER